jgi:hypothetical protein
MDDQKLNHTTWNCKYPIVFIPKRRKQVIRATADPPGRIVPSIGPPKRLLDCGGSLGKRPCAYVHEYPAEVCSVSGDGLSERKKCDLHRQTVYGQTAKFMGRRRN